MSKFKRSFAKNNTPTKGELVDRYEERFKAISSAVQQVLMLGSRQNQALAGQLAELAQQVEKADYRSLATMEMLAEKGILTTDSHVAYVEAIRIREFERQSTEDDVKRGLTPAEGKSKIGQFITVRLSAFDNETGAPIDKLTVFRSKVQIGSGNLHPTIEQEFIGIAVGETKEAVVELPPEFQELAGKKVKFNITAIDLKDAPPPKPVEEAPKAANEETEVQV